eukprot:3307838-Rhodomonas_salina.3
MTGPDVVFPGEYHVTESVRIEQDYISLTAEPNFNAKDVKIIGCSKQLQDLPLLCIMGREVSVTNITFEYKCVSEGHREDVANCVATGNTNGIPCCIEIGENSNACFTGCRYVAPR